MKLLIDAGNTRIKWALVNGGGDWVRSGALPVEQANELPGLLEGQYDKLQIWVSNVAGEYVANLVRNIGERQSAQTNFVVAREKQCGVRNGYSNHAQLGSDRWAALIAAWHLAHGKCLVVNCGTAITIDALSVRGEFCGGLILPGIELMLRSLAGGTDQLRSALVKPAQGKYVQFPLNTSDALFSGAIQAGCGAIQRQHALLGDADAPIIISGGAAELLRGHLDLPLRAVDDLVLRGVQLISQESDA